MNSAAPFLVIVFLLSGNLVSASTPTTQIGTEERRDHYRRDVLAEKGDAQRGEHLFENAAKTRCKLCHAVEGRGNSLGPDLLGVGGRYDRAGLLESVLNPSAKLHPNYVATTVVTSSGKVVTGILRTISEIEVEIAVNETERVRLRADEIEERHPSKTSTIPTGLDEKLSPSEMADLLAFLAGLRATVSGTLRDARSPRDIAHAKRAVRFVPMINREQAFRRPVWFGQFPGRPGVHVVLEVDRGRVWLLQGELEQARKTLFVDLSSASRVARSLA